MRNWAPYAGRTTRISTLTCSSRRSPASRYRSTPLRNDEPDRIGTRFVTDDWLLECISADLPPATESSTGVCMPRRHRLVRHQARREGNGAVGARPDCKCGHMWLHFVHDLHRYS